MNPPDPTPLGLSSWAAVSMQRQEKKVRVAGGEIVLVAHRNAAGDHLAWVEHRRGGFVVTFTESGHPTAEAARARAEWAARKILRMDLEGDA